MKRVAFTMKLKPNCVQEYKRRHDEIWPQLVEELKQAGIFDFSIYHDPSSDTLFAQHKLKSDEASEEQPGGEVQRRWWRYMKELMDTNPDDSPVTSPLLEVFHLD